MRSKLFACAAVLLLLACSLAAVGSSAQKDKKPGKSAAPPRTASVTIKNFEFQPKTLTVKPGTVVTWTNDAGSHTVVADDDSFTSPTLGAGQTFSHKFDRKGAYPYHCSFHGGKGGEDMAGTVVVQP